MMAQVDGGTPYCLMVCLVSAVCVVGWLRLAWLLALSLILFLLTVAFDPQWAPQTDPYSIRTRTPLQIQFKILKNNNNN